MNQFDTSTIVTALAYPLSITILVGLVSLGVILRGWTRSAQKSQEAKLHELAQQQRVLENQILKQAEFMAARVDNWSRDVHSQLGGHAQQLKVMNDAVGSLKTALVVPHLRGRILGETALERLLSDVLPPHAYAYQYDIGGARVDAVIRFPHVGLIVPIDAKFHFAGAQVLLEGSTDENLIKESRKQLAQSIRGSAREIAKKYVRPELGTTDFAYLFVPSEAVFQEILHDVDLWQSLVDEQVLVVSPHTLFVALQPLSHAVRYYEMSLGVNEKIKLLQESGRTLEDLSGQVSEQLTKAMRALEQSQRMISSLPHLASSLTTPESNPVAHVAGDAGFTSPHAVPQ
ncbi:MAG: DNA recombination protein RmuC [Betaproteobacteria bacterium]|nr:DNA recombination protein RmuC [Betaproteobacteria bacterium]